MTFTSASEIIVSAEKVRLHFDFRLRPPTSWRELFSNYLFSGKRAASERTRIDAIDNLCFEIRKGDRIGILGKNGSGKTSLCRCIAGIYEPHSGRIERTGKLRCVFGGFPMIEPELTGRENARLLANLFYEKVPARKGWLSDALDFSELGKLLDMPVKFYSAGMNARLVLSVISAAPCDLLILDEVFDGADQFFREKIGNRMQELMKKSGAVLFVSHSTEQIRRNCNRLWIYEGGSIVFDGDVEEGIALYSQQGSTTH